MSERSQSIIVIIIICLIVSYGVFLVVEHGTSYENSNDEPKTEYEPPKLLSIGDSTTVNGIMYTIFKEPKVHKGDAFERPDGTFFKTYVKVRLGHN